MRKSYFSLVFVPVILLGLGCQKYEPLKGVANPAYFRIFNSITNCQHSYFAYDRNLELSAGRLLCLLIDPETNGSGAFTGGVQIGDFLGFRAYDAAPYSTFPNDDIRTFKNTEYPGVVRMPSGGVINGLDAACWGQILSGKHRLVFLRRLGASRQYDPSPSLYFTQYPAAGQDSAFRLALDTTVDLAAGGIYSMDLVSASTADQGALRLLVRQERWKTDDLSDTNRIYVNFYNYLESPGSPEALDVYYQWQYVIQTTGPLVAPQLQPPLSYSPAAVNNYTSGFDSSAETFLTTMKERYSMAPPAYSPLAMPPADSFHYEDGPAFGQYRLPFDRPRLLLKFYLPGQSAATGAHPFTTVVCNEQYSEGQVLRTTPTASLVNGSEDDGAGAGGTMVSLYQTVTYNNQAHSFPMVCSMFLMNHYSGPNMLTPGLVIPYLVALQRPFEASLIQP